MEKINKEYVKNLMVQNGRGCNVLSELRKKYKLSNGDIQNINNWKAHLINDEEIQSQIKANVIATNKDKIFIGYDWLNNRNIINTKVVKKIALAAGMKHPIYVYRNNYQSLYINYELIDPYGDNPEKEVESIFEYCLHFNPNYVHKEVILPDKKYVPKKNNIFVKIVQKLLR